MIWVLSLCYFPFAINAIKINFNWQVVLSTIPATINYLLLYLAINSDYTAAKAFVSLGAVLWGISNTYLNLIMGQ